MFTHEGLSVADSNGWNRKRHIIIICQNKLLFRHRAQVVILSNMCVRPLLEMPRQELDAGVCNSNPKCDRGWMLCERRRDRPIIQNTDLFDYYKQGFRSPDEPEHLSF